MLENTEVEEWAVCVRVRARVHGCVGEGGVRVRAGW